MPDDDEMSVLHTAVNPANNNTYHLLTASSWEDAASYARSLDGFLVTVDDDAENTWLFETFSSWDNTSRHLWIGLSDHSAEGEYRWHDGTPFLYRNWGDAQPSEGGDEHFVHIASTNMGNIMPGSWNDLENDPQYFPVYGVVEIGPGADYALRFDGAEDHVVMDHNDRLDMENITHLELSAWVHPYGTEGNQFILMKGDYGWGMYLSDNRLAFSSEYSLSQHPVSDGIVEADEWSHVQVNVVVGEGYTFRINGNDAGVVIDEDATILWVISVPTIAMRTISPAMNSLSEGWGRVASAITLRGCWTTSLFEQAQTTARRRNGFTLNSPKAKVAKPPRASMAMWPLSKALIG